VPRLPGILAGGETREHHRLVDLASEREVRIVGRRLGEQLVDQVGAGACGLAVESGGSGIAVAQAVDGLRRELTTIAGAQLLPYC